MLLITNNKTNNAMNKCFFFIIKQLNLPNFFRAQIYSALATLKIGMELLENENVKIDRITGHGGFFKTPKVGQRLLAGAVKTPVSVIETAGEGGAWGMALLASYMIHKKENQTLEEYLAEEVFTGARKNVVQPEREAVMGFEKFMERYREGLAIEQAAVSHLK